MSIRTQLLRNLIVTALVDQRLTESELELLKEYARLWNIDETTFAQLVRETLESEPGAVRLPIERSQAVQLLEEMLRMMAADGKLADREKQLFARVAVALDMSQDEITALIDRTIQKYEKP